MHEYKMLQCNVHRLIPSKFPPVSLFDWADSPEELEQIARLEGLTNDRLLAEYGHINLVAREDWIGGEGSTPLMAAFTHIGKKNKTRFCDGSFGVYYAADTLLTAVKETVFHREIFYRASNEVACFISMREYIAKVHKPLIDITQKKYEHLLHPDPKQYKESQTFAADVRKNNAWGIYYPSVRREGSQCVAIFRPPALTIPKQGCHLEYVWDGARISEINKISKLQNV